MTYNRELVLNTQDCVYHPKAKRLTISTEKIAGSIIFPHTVYVKSHHTNNQITFKPIKETHNDFDQDQWDGEQQIYEPIYTGVKVNVKTLVIYRAE
jgi:hypothetical protein